MHYFFLAAFFWLNAMCFNIWWTFRWVFFLSLFLPPSASARSRGAWRFIGSNNPIILFPASREPQKSSVKRAQWFIIRMQGGHEALSMHLRPRLFNEEGEGQASKPAVKVVAWRGAATHFVFLFYCCRFSIIRCAAWESPIKRLCIGKELAGCTRVNHFPPSQQTHSLRKFCVLMSKSGAIRANSIRVSTLLVRI